MDGLRLPSTLLTVVMIAWSGSACSPLLTAGDSTFNDGPSLKAEGTLSSPTHQVDPSFGNALAISGNTLAAAAAFEDEGTRKRAGAVYLYDLGTYGELAKIVAPNAGEDDGAVPATVLPVDLPHGISPPSLSLALNDQSLVVGTGGEDSGTGEPSDDSAAESGAVYVYDRAHLPGEVQYIKSPTIQAGQVFGASVALSEPWLAVGAPGDGEKAGAVFVYRRDRADGQFKNPEYLKAPNADAGDFFGASIAMDGKRLIVGAVGEDGSDPGAGGNMQDNATTNCGAAYVFELHEDQWGFAQYMKPTDITPQIGPALSFGFSVALSANQILVGAPAAVACSPSDIATGFRGAVFTFDTVFWTEHCLPPRNPEGSNLFGFTVAFASDQPIFGAPWEIGGFGAAPAKQFAGATYLLEDGRADYLNAPRTESVRWFGLGLAASSERVAVYGVEPLPASANIDDDAHKNGTIHVYSLVN